MSLLRVILLATAVSVLSTVPAVAQRGAPRQRTSPHETVSAVIAGNRVTVTYGRPYSKNPRGTDIRKIWGELVPYDKIWRTGADEATLLISQKPIVIAGPTIPGNTAFSIFTLPAADGSCKFIVNK